MAGSQGGAIPIGYADILMAKNRNREEIAAIESELAALSQVDALIGAR